MTEDRSTDQGTIHPNDVKWPPVGCSPPLFTCNSKGEWTVQRVLDRLADLPVDIRPIFVDAGEHR